MFRGKVISGLGVGRTLGYPTANLDTPQNEIPLGSGVYAVRAELVGKTYAAALVLSHEPWKVEVHLLEYDGTSCYGRVMDVFPVQKVSELERIESEEELKKKIMDDIELVKRVLSR
ncbi:MAG TPA: riboflavin kinase [Candidatus Kapabacteria bacterium]|nr:riboflavin kinase [Candidatus Kapabacteria bacterium]